MRFTFVNVLANFVVATSALLCHVVLVSMLYHDVSDLVDKTFHAVPINSYPICVYRIY